MPQQIYALARLSEAISVTPPTKALAIASQISFDDDIWRYTIGIAALSTSTTHLIPDVCHFPFAPVELSPEVCLGRDG
jgi:hypothetical protein